MTSVAIGMRTIQRAHGVDYLDETLINARRAGVFDSPMLAGFDVCDGGSADPRRHLAFARGLAGVDVHVVDEKVSPNENATRAHEFAENHGADLVLFMEDDLDFCADFLASAVAWLSDHHDERVPLYVLGHVKRGSGTSLRYPVRGWYASQCYAVPGRAHSQLVRWLQDHPLYDNGQVKRPRCHDLRLHNWGAHVGCDHWIASVPSLVSHIGERSGMGCPPVRFVSWPGRAWRYRGRAAA